MRENGVKKLTRVDLGLTDYRSCWEIQKQLIPMRVSGAISDCLLFTEHKPVITKGRATDPENLLFPQSELARKGVELFEIERGGDITFHGPGQLVIYPIIDLNSHGRDLHKYLRDLEKTIIVTLEKIGIVSGIKKGMTGVWVGNTKIAAIGVAVSRWITYHGAALNVNTDLDYYKLINPCGITDHPVGSIKSISGKNYEIARIADLAAESFCEVFDYEIEYTKGIDSMLDSEKIEK